MYKFSNSKYTCRETKLTHWKRHWTSFLSVWSKQNKENSNTELKISNEPYYLEYFEDADA